MIEIRPYQKSDFLQVKELLEEAKMFAPPWESDENLSGMVDVNPESILVAVNSESGKIVGNVFLIPYGPKVVIMFRLVVRKEFQRRGIATDLITAVLEIAKTKNIDEVGLFVDQDKPEIKEFYKKRGFTNVSQEPSFYMWKDIE